MRQGIARYAQKRNNGAACTYAAYRLTPAIPAMTPDDTTAFARRQPSGPGVRPRQIVTSIGSGMSSCRQADETNSARSGP